MQWLVVTRVCLENTFPSSLISSARFFFHWSIFSRFSSAYCRGHELFISSGGALDHLPHFSQQTRSSCREHSGSFIFFKTKIKMNPGHHRGRWVLLMMVMDDGWWMIIFSSLSWWCDVLCASWGASAKEAKWRCHRTAGTRDWTWNGFLQHTSDRQDDQTLCLILSIPNLHCPSWTFTFYPG